MAEDGDAGDYGVDGDFSAGMMSKHLQWRCGLCYSITYGMALQGIGVWIGKPITFPTNLGV